MLYSITVICLHMVLYSMPQVLSAQLTINDKCQISVQKVYPSFSINQEEIAGLQFISDLNPHFKKEWIKEYYEVTFSTLVKGQTQQVQSSSNAITSEQKLLIANADLGSPIRISIDYLPDNSLSQNEVKNFSFEAIVEPSTQATFSNSNLDLNQYLKQHLDLQKIQECFREHAVAAVKFTVSASGTIINTELAESSSDIQLDEKLVAAIRDMPDWTPAKYNDGTTASQDLVLTVGDHNSCTMNQFNIRKDGKPYLAE